MFDAFPGIPNRPHPEMVSISAAPVPSAEEKNLHPDVEMLEMTDYAQEMAEIDHALESELDPLRKPRKRSRRDGARPVKLARTAKVLAGTGSKVTKLSATATQAAGRGEASSVLKAASKDLRKVSNVISDALLYNKIKNAFAASKEGRAIDLQISALIAEQTELSQGSEETSPRAAYISQEIERLQAYKEKTLNAAYYSLAEGTCRVAKQASNVLSKVAPAFTVVAKTVGKVATGVSVVSQSVSLANNIKEAELIDVSVRSMQDELKKAHHPLLAQIMKTRLDLLTLKYGDNTASTVRDAQMLLLSGSSMAIGVAAAAGAAVASGVGGFVVGVVGLTVGTAYAARMIYRSRHVMAHSAAEMRSKVQLLCVRAEHFLRDCAQGRHVEKAWTELEQTMQELQAIGVAYNEQIDLFDDFIKQTNDDIDALHEKIADAREEQVLIPQIVNDIAISLHSTGNLEDLADKVRDAIRQCKADLEYRADQGLDGAWKQGELAFLELYAELVQKMLQNQVASEEYLHLVQAKKEHAVHSDRLISEMSESVKRLQTTHKDYFAAMDAVERRRALLAQELDQFQELGKVGELAWYFQEPLEAAYTRLKEMAETLQNNPQAEAAVRDEFERVGIAETNLMQGLLEYFSI